MKGTPKHNKRIHSDKIKLRRFAMQLYFAGDAKRYVARGRVR